MQNLSHSAIDLWFINHSAKTVPHFACIPVFLGGFAVIVCQIFLIWLYVCNFLSGFKIALSRLLKSK